MMVQGWRGERCCQIEDVQLEKFKYFRYPTWKYKEKISNIYFMA